MCRGRCVTFITVTAIELNSCLIVADSETTHYHGSGILFGENARALRPHLRFSSMRIVFDARNILPAVRTIPSMEGELFPGIDDADSGGLKMSHIARGNGKASRGGAGCDIGIGGDGRFAGLFTARRDFS